MIDLHRNDTSSVELLHGIRYREGKVDGWIPVSESFLLIFVGLTGVGKTTLVDVLSQKKFQFLLLPNRRILTDKFIIPTVMKMDGDFPQKKVICRIERFSYTRRYKQHFPAGMVEVLRQLQVNLSQLKPLLFFDGLRGEEELVYAISMLPRAYFLVLEAPYDVRLDRLLTRNDLFDRVMNSSIFGTDKVEVYSPEKIFSFSQLGIPEADNLFSSSKVQEILDKLNDGHFSVRVLCNYLRIIIEEQYNYDPEKTRATIEKQAPHRALFLDTVASTPEQMAEAVKYFLESLGYVIPNPVFLGGV